MAEYIMALDQGTTSSRCILFGVDGKIVSSSAREFPQIFPKEGWVEHHPMTIWSSQIGAAAEALTKIGGQWQDVSHRRTRIQRHRMAMQTHRRLLWRAEGARIRPHDQGKNGAFA